MMHPHLTRTAARAARIARLKASRTFASSSVRLAEVELTIGKSQVAILIIHRSLLVSVDGKKVSIEGSTFEGLNRRQVLMSLSGLCVDTSL